MGVIHSYCVSDCGLYCLSVILHPLRIMCVYPAIAQGVSFNLQFVCRPPPAPSTPRRAQRQAERERREQEMQSPQNRRRPVPFALHAQGPAAPAGIHPASQDPFALPNVQLVDIMWNGVLRRVPADMAAQFLAVAPQAPNAAGRRVSSLRTSFREP
jgi:hypothetical protein